MCSMIPIPGSLSFVKLLMMSSAPAESAGDARYASQDRFIQSTFSHTISTPICITSALFPQSVTTNQAVALRFQMELKFGIKMLVYADIPFTVRLLAPQRVHLFILMLNVTFYIVVLYFSFSLFYTHSNHQKVSITLFLKI